MKLCDTLRLVKNEFRYGKMEWIVSVILQILILSCAFFVFSLVIDMDRLGDAYLGKLYPDGYEFSLQGYTEADRSVLESRGFYNLSLGEEGGVGTLDEIKGIWISKIKAVMDGKDIWNQEVDEFLVIIGLFQVIFGIVAGLLTFVMLNNLSNSFSMKLLRREHYITMMFRLGCRKKEIRRIYYIFFSVRNFVSLLAACGINAGFIILFNRYIANLLGISSGMKIIRLAEAAGLFLFMELMMRIVFGKIWSESNANNG